MTGRTHFVYTAYDAEGCALYVGCTKDPGARYCAHMSSRSGQSAYGWFGPFVLAFGRLGWFLLHGPTVAREVCERHPSKFRITSQLRCCSSVQTLVGAHFDSTSRELLALRTTSH